MNNVLAFFERMHESEWSKKGLVKPDVFVASHSHVEVESLSNVDDELVAI